MRVVTKIGEMQNIVDDLRRDKRIVSLVPTMGYLHDGHLSLMKIARQNSDIVIVSIFVNPTQFAPHEDFGSYPRDIAGDTKLANSAGVDFLFTPEKNEIYPADYATFVDVDEITEKLEGKSRPTHFRGVATIVTKLFNIAKPHVAIFGQKDAQQALVIKKIVFDLNFGIKIIIAPTIREKDGLAMSSRNSYLTKEQRQESPVLYESLTEASKMISGGITDCLTIKEKMIKLISMKQSAKIDYISIADSTDLEEVDVLQKGGTYLISLAVKFGNTRLIDNIIQTI
ncbi:MAG: pantoate--beta-alanine ligase [Ignavibacteriales bacterium]|nr:pantoate--beta-alanine ligase [Ignavibacteriales bacterium]